MSPSHPARSPLAGKRVLLARAEGQSSSSESLLRDRGAEPVVIPAIVIGPPSDPEPLRRALAPGSLGPDAWVAFTSANGVEHVWRLLQEEGRSAVEALAGARLAAVGAVTADALRARGVVPDLVARAFRAEGLASELLALPTPRRVVIFRAEKGSEVLPDALRAAGIPVEVVAAYRTTPSLEGAREIRGLLGGGGLDAVIFSSGSTVDAIGDALGPDAAALLGLITVACIGPVTAAAAAARAWRVDVVPPVATLAATIAALEERFRAI